MQATIRPEISVVVPVFNERPCLPELFVRLCEALDQLAHLTSASSWTTAAAIARSRCCAPSTLRALAKRA